MPHGVTRARARPPRRPDALATGLAGGAGILAVFMLVSIVLGVLAGRALLVMIGIALALVASWLLAMLVRRRRGR
jgi:hypothetical protein